MNRLNPDLIATVSAALKGKRLEHFTLCVGIVNTSLAQGGWTPRGSAKAGSIQGLSAAKLGLSALYPRRTYDAATRVSVEAHPLHGVAKDLENCIKRGWLHTDVSALCALLDVPEVCARLRAAKLAPSLVRAWIEFRAEYQEACTDLNEARPLPRVTAIGLSPRVTATLKECNLDLDLPSIKLAKIDYYKTQVCDKEGKPVQHRTGKWAMQREHFVAWTPGIVHGASRFAANGRCHACGKRIPSCRFVPIEANDKRSGQRISMWLGSDCAANIFGIKDEGLRQP